MKEKISKASGLAKNTILLLVNKFSSQLVSIVLLPIYTALFSANNYGAATLALTYISFLTPLATIRLDMGIFRFMIDARGDTKQIMTFISSTFSIIFPLTAVILLTGTIVGVLLDIPLSTLIVINLVIAVISSILSQMTRGLGDTITFVIASIIGTICSFATVLLGIFVFGVGFEILLIAPIIANSVIVLILAHKTKIHKFIHRSMASKSVRQQLIKYSFPLIPDSMSFWIMNVSDRTVLSIVLGAASNGIYTVSNKITAVLDGLIGVFYMSWSEEAALLNKKIDRDKLYSDMMIRYIKIFWSLCLVALAAIPFIFRILVQGDEFNSAYLYIPILIIAMGIHAFENFFAAIYQAQKLTRQLAITTIAGAIANVIVNVALVFWIGIWAAAISTLAAYAILSVYRYFDIRKYGVVLRLSPRLLVLFMALAVIICTFYYINIFWLNVVGVLAAIGVGGWLNWEVLRAGWGMVLEKLGRGKTQKMRE